jgi:hypothetical protein
MPERIDPQANFARLGMDSAASVFLIAELKDWLGLRAQRRADIQASNTGCIGPLFGRALHYPKHCGRLNDRHAR